MPEPKARARYSWRERRRRRSYSRPVPWESVAKGLIDRALRLGEGREFKEYERRVASINRIEDEMDLLEDEEIRSEADDLRERAREGEALDDLLPEAFALCREAARRNLGQRHFDVQLI